MLRKYYISAIHIPIVYNKFGDVDPNGLMYVLAENEDTVKNWYVIITIPLKI